jgi:hypothetical protein
VASKCAECGVHMIGVSEPIWHPGKCVSKVSLVAAPGAQISYVFPTYLHTYLQLLSFLHTETFSYVVMHDFALSVTCSATSCDSSDPHILTGCNASVFRTAYATVMV